MNWKCLFGFHDWKIGRFIDYKNRESEERICRSCLRREEKHICNCGEEEHG